MIEKIGTPGFEMLSMPDQNVVRLVGELIERNPSGAIVYYEIGVGIGTTTLAVAKAMDNRGRILLFSLEREVRELSRDLAGLGFFNIDSRWGSPSKLYSGYHFQLATGFVNNDLDRFDLAYIDGGHVFHLDAPAACVLKELCNPGGYMLFDDWRWTIARSPSMRPSARPETLKQYDDEQIATPQVQLVCRVVMDTDQRFEFLGVDGDTAIYRRRE